VRIKCQKAGLNGTEWRPETLFPVSRSPFQLVLRSSPFESPNKRNN
jgi:hypothetical protein